jgi:transposase
MRPPIFVRPLTAAERADLEAGLRSKDAHVLRRCQILLASARGERAPRIAATLGCNDQTVRNVIAAFEREGLQACSPRRRSRPRSDRAKLDALSIERLRALLHQSPRTFGKPTGVWTLALAAQVSFEQGLIPERVSDETIRMALKRLGIRWRRAKRWIASPDPWYARKKGARDRLIRLAGSHPTWALGFEDEVWWSRLARPALHTWAEGDRSLRLVEHATAKDDPDPKALACYGLLVRWAQPDRRWREEVWLRFVPGRPLSGITTRYLAWCSAKLQAIGKEALLLVWDNASWHVSREVRGWIRQHNREVQRTGTGVRIVSCYLPTKSPWLNPIEPKWVHGKRRVVEPARLLPARELVRRVCAAFDCPHEAHLAMPDVSA